MVFRVALLSLIAFVLLGVKGEGFAPIPFGDVSIVGTSLVDSWGFIWDDCDYGGDVPTPILAWHFEGPTRQSGFWELHDNVGSTTPAENSHIRCNENNVAPYCGLDNTTGGPGGPNNAYFDLSDTDATSGTAHVGFRKDNNDSDENFAAANEFTIAWHSRTTGANIGMYFFYRNPVLQVNVQPFFAGFMCSDVISYGPDPIVDDGHCNIGGMNQVSFSGYANLGWEAWMFVFDGDTTGSGAGTYKWYKNGRLVYTQTGVDGVVSDTVAGNYLALGSVNTWGNNSDFDNPQIWNSALTAANALHVAYCVVPE